MWKVTHCDASELFATIEDALAWVSVLTRNKARFTVTYVYHQG